MTRRSKIANLRKEIRGELNQKLEDGEQAKQVVEWLNSQPEVQDTLRWRFKGQPITEQNLSEWRHTGFLDWQRAQEAWKWVQQLSDEAGELKDRGFGSRISDWFGTLMSAELTSTARELIQQETDPEKRWERLCAVYKQVSRLRKDDLAATRTRLRQEKWMQDIQQSLRDKKRGTWDLCTEDAEEIFRRRPDPEIFSMPPMPKRKRKKSKAASKPAESSLIQVNPVSESPAKPG